VIRKTATFQVRREGLAKSLAAITEFVAYVRANEPGTLRYESWQEKGDPTRFLHVFTFTDGAAERIHSNSKAVEHFIRVLYPECVEPVVFTDFDLAASTEPQR
jgi:quinol monooxygenase YgiN